MRAHLCAQVRFQYGDHFFTTDYIAVPVGPDKFQGKVYAVGAHHAKTGEAMTDQELADFCAEHVGKFEKLATYWATKVLFGPLDLGPGERVRIEENPGLAEAMEARNLEDTPEGPKPTNQNGTPKA